MPQKMEYTVLDMIESAVRQARVQPLNLGGLSGADGGGGGPPGGFIGQLIQSRVTYDTTEAATLAVPASGMSLVDNLNHIRYRIGSLETGSTPTLRVEDYDGNPSVYPVSRIVFSGASITNQGYGRVLVAFSGGGGGGGDDGTYLRLDATNDPLTGQLAIIPTTNDEGGIYIETQGDAYTADFEQYGYGSETITSPAFFVYRGPGDGSNVLFNTHLVEYLDDAKPGSTGGFMKYTASGVILVDLKPKAANQNFQYKLLNLAAPEQIIFQVFDAENDYLVVTQNAVYGPQGALLTERSWFAINEADETLEWGVGATKEANAGKIGYESFGAGYLHITGAGTSVGTRKVKLYDKTYCDLFIGGIQLVSMPNVAVLGTNADSTIIDGTTGADARYAPIAKGVTNGDSHNHVGGDGGTLTTAALSDLASGTYTPTPTNIAGTTTSSVSGTWKYSRVGNIVHVAGACSITPTSGSGTVQVDFTIPIASAFTANTHASGNGTSQATNAAGNIIADAANDRVSLVFQSPTTSAMPWRIVFMYEII